MSEYETNEPASQAAATAPAPAAFPAFDPTPAPVAPAAPVAPVAPVAPAAPVAPVAPVPASVAPAPVAPAPVAPAPVAPAMDLEPPPPPPATPVVEAQAQDFGSPMASDLFDPLPDIDPFAKEREEAPPPAPPVAEALPPEPAPAPAPASFDPSGMWAASKRRSSFGRRHDAAAPEPARDAAASPGGRKFSLRMKVGRG